MNVARLFALAAGAALALLYLDFAYSLVQSNVVSHASAFEQGIFFLQFGKVAVIAAFRRFRDMHFVNVVNVMGAEVVVALPALALVTVAFGSQDASILTGQLFLAWIAGAAASVTPYATYRVTRAMLRRDPLLIVLPSGVVLSELLLLLKSGTESAAASGTGLAGLSRAIILLGGGSAAPGTQLQGAAILVPLSVIYVSFLLHSLSPGGDPTMRKFVTVAGFAVVVTGLTYAGTLVASTFSFPLPYLVLPPTLVTAALVWWSTREA